MSDRIQAALDGEIPANELNPEERQEFEALAASSALASEWFGRTQAPDLTQHVMAEIRPRAAPAALEPSGRVRGWLGLLWQPRTIALRPIWGLLAAAMAVLLLLPGGDPPSPGELPATASEGVTIFVQFRFHDPDASEVHLAGTFTDWEPRHELRPAGDGSWTVLVPMAPGVHDYAFVVDGTHWEVDPSAPRVDDGFGGENSRLALLLTNGTRGS